MTCGGWRKTLFVISTCFVLSAFGQEKPFNTWYFVYIAHTHSLCTRALHLKRPHVACGGLLNERLWEVVVLPRGRPCITHSCQSGLCNSHYRGKQSVSGWCLKVLSGLCLERGRMMKMMAGYICFQQYQTSVICWIGSVWTLHKDVLLCGNVKPKKIFEQKPTADMLDILNFNNIFCNWLILNGKHLT